MLALKALHLAALIVWCAALLALPVLLKWREPARDPGSHERLCRLTQRAYTRLATPAAVIAIGAGTGLLFVREVFEPWMFAKLVAVALLVVLHMRIGLALEALSLGPGQAPRPRAVLQLLGVVLTIGVVLVLVLAKPVAPRAMWPDWLLTPRDQPMPVAEPPMR